MSGVYRVLSILIVIIVLSVNAAPFYGGMVLKSQDKKLNDRYFIATTVFTRENANKDDEWKRNNIVYNHLDGSFFSTSSGQNIKRWYARMTHNQKKHTEITQVINDNGRKSAYLEKDLAAYNLYLYTGNTNNYDASNDKIDFYAEPQTVFTCYMTAMNNLMQYPVFTQNKLDKKDRLVKGSMQDELDRQYKIFAANFESKSSFETAELWKPEYTMNMEKGQFLLGDNVKQMQDALKWNFNVAMTEIAEHFLNPQSDKEAFNKKTPVKKIKLPDTRTPKYMLDHNVIGYIVGLKMGEWRHWVAIKYFNNGAWFNDENEQKAGGKPLWVALCGSALNPEHGHGPDKGFFTADDFETVYGKIFDYWKDHKGKHIDGNHLFECTKSAKGKDTASQSMVHHYPHNPHYHQDNHKYIEYDHEYDGYHNDPDNTHLFNTLMLEISSIALITVSFCCCLLIGSVFGYFMAKLVHSNKNQIKSNQYENESV